MTNIPNEYREIENKLVPIADEYELDKVTLNGLIKSCVRIIEPDMEPANIIRINKDLSSGERLSLKSFRVDLKYALDLIYSARTLVSSKKIWFVLALLKIILQLLGRTYSELDYQEAVVVFCCYRLGRANLERIKRYISQLKKESVINDIEINADEACDNLEKYNIIEMIDGNYVLREYIIIEK